jgi:hypothetical protein
MPFGLTRSRLFGDIALVAFLLCQLLDGALTYVGIVNFGAHIESNPLMLSFMGAIGHGPALATAKVTAGVLGILLHLRQVHGVLAALTGVYFMVAIVPWTLLLLFF